MVDVVGLRFITEGEQTARNALKAYQSGLTTTSRIMDQFAAGMNRAFSQEVQQVNKLMSLRQRAASEQQKDITQGAQRVNLLMRLRDRAAKEQEQAAARAQRAVQQQDAEDRRALQSYLRYQNEKERAAREAARAQEEAARRAAAATAAEAAERDRLATKFNPLYAASKQYERALEELNAAQRMGIVTSAQYDNALEQLNTQLAMGATANRGLGAASHFASRAQNATGMALQQTGYQVGDFLVQIQGGTNAFVAFGQQATQLVGILPMFGSVMGIAGTNLIALSAGLGIAIPLLTAAGAAIMRTRKDAEEAQVSYEGLGESLQRLEDVRLESVGRSLADGAREAADEWRNVLGLIERVEMRSLADTIRTEFDALVEELASFENRLQTAARLGNAAPEFDMFGLESYEQGLEFARAIRAVEGQTREELQESLKAAEERLRTQQILTPETEEVLANLAEELGIVDSVTQQLQEQHDVQRRINDTLTERVNARAADRQEGNALLDQLMAEIALSETILRFGADSAEVESRRAVQARATFESRLDELDVTEDLRARIREAYAQQQELTNQIEESERAADGLAGGMDRVGDRASAAAAQVMGILNALQASMRTIEAMEAGAAAAQRVAAAGGSETDVRVAQTVATREAELRASGVVDEGELTEILAQTADVERRTLAANEAMQALFATFREGGRGGGGGGSARELTTLQAVTAELIAEEEARRAVLAMTDQQRRVEEARIDIVQQLGDASANYTQQELERGAQLLALERQRVEQAEQLRRSQEQAAQTITGLLMAAVDGADALQKALQNLLRQMATNFFQQAIFQSLSGGKLGAFGDALLVGFGGTPTAGAANGAVMSQGSITPFANGGVVNSPTTFPMRNGSTGLMGEAGPEAVMPLRRGRDGKLGVASSGGKDRVQVVNQVINNTGQPARQESGTLPDGREYVRTIVGEEVSRGSMDKSFGNRFGMSPSKIRR